MGLEGLEGWSKARGIMDENSFTLSTHGLLEIWAQPFCFEVSHQAPLFSILHCLPTVEATGGPRREPVLPRRGASEGKTRAIKGSLSCL
jgi:hypothetical protein